MRERSPVVAAVVLAFLLVVTGPAVAAPGDPLWTETIAGSADQDDQAFDLEVSNDGARAFVTGWVTSSAGGYDVITAAYDTVLGTELWRRRFDGGAHDLDQGVDLALLGHRVFVTGTTYRGGAPGADIVTLAYDAATGTRLWMRRYDSPGGGEDSGRGVDAVPGHVLVTGQAGSKIVTMALAPRTGSVRWTRTTKRSGEPSLILARGDRAYAFGRTVASGFFDAWVTAYRIDTGQPIWTRGWSTAGHDGFDDAALSADGSDLYGLGTSGETMLLVAYDAAGGVRRWRRLPAPQPEGFDEGRGVAVAPDGSAVYVVGESFDVFTDPTYLTMAYDRGGGLLWTAREQAFDDDGFPNDVVASPDGTEVWVTGTGRNVVPSNRGALTIAYAAAVGAPSLWEHQTSGTMTFGSGAMAIAAAPDGSAVYVAGRLDTDLLIEGYEA